VLQSGGGADGDDTGQAVDPDDQENETDDDQAILWSSGDVKLYRLDSCK
jgi:hypothetical protein